jgi:HEAT repeat protein
MKTWKTTNRVTLAAASLLIAAGSAAIAQNFAEDQAEKSDAEREARNAMRDAQNAARDAQNQYREALRHIDARDYAKAVSELDAVAHQKNKNSDAALYWEAWAQNRLGRQQDALRALGALRQSYPSSRWLNDAKALEMEMGGKAVSPDAVGDDDLKGYALDGLMNSDPQRAMPILEKVIQGSGSPKFKEKALFVLAQNGSPKAREILVRIAKGQGNPDLQRKAVEYLGIFGGQENRQLLHDIYKSTGDLELKRRILNSFMVSGDKASLFDLAKTDPNPELREQAVNQLGVSGGVNELWQLYSTESNREVKRSILNGLFLTGQPEKLYDLANNEKDPSLRVEAIKKLGLMGADKTSTFLTTLYAKDSDPGVKHAAIEGLFLSGDAKALVAIARKENDPARRRDIVQKLSIMGSKEATDYLLELLNK